MLNRTKAFFFELFHIFFRHYNFPCSLGLMRVGNPGRHSPVFLSGNYTLTVRRVLRKLKGLDCYLLVANSRGSNVWCAAGMNEFSEYDVIDAINVSELASTVSHRRIIAPPYGAPGVDIRAVKKETGFNIHWGPTHLDDLPRYIANGFKRTNDMFQVQFGLIDRLEQAVSTALAYTMTIGMVVVWFWPMFMLKLTGVIYLVYMTTFSLIPRLPEERRWRRTMWNSVILVSLVAGFGLLGGWSWGEILMWSAITEGVVILSAMDLCGSSPDHKTTLVHWLRHGNYASDFDPVIDPELCVNCMQCVLTCPRDVFAARKAARTVVAVHPDRCEECLHCVKQCPTDAILNRTGEYKEDVKSIPGLDQLMTRDWSYLKDEDVWLGAETEVNPRNGIPYIAKEHEASYPVREWSEKGAA